LAPIGRTIRRGLDYSRYLGSMHWRRTRLAALTRADYRCQRCGHRGTDETRETGSFRLEGEEARSINWDKAELVDWRLYAVFLHPALKQ
jgi:hypothetical protein